MAAWSALTRATTSATSASVDLAGCGSPRLMLLGQLLLPERQDRVGVETVEGAEFDHPIVKLAADAGSVDAGSERAFQPGRVEVDLDGGRRHGLLQSPPLRRPEDALPGGDELLE